MPNNVPEPTTEVVELHAGQKVWYVRGGEPACRPAMLLSDGIIETARKLEDGVVRLKQYANLIYGTLDPQHELLGNDHADGPSQRQTHETTVPWDPQGSPGTWHLDGEAAHLFHPTLGARPETVQSRGYREMAEAAARRPRPQEAP